MYQSKFLFDINRLLKLTWSIFVWITLCTVWGHWVVLARGTDSSLLDYNRYILEMILGMISLVWQLKSDVWLFQLQLESKLGLMVQRVWELESLEQLLQLGHHLLEEGFFHKREDEYQLIQLTFQV